ncbi:MAG: N-formylglutamate amidohydrolase [Spirochaetes bacterium]|nr:N-formylglutamate amidohydrolase [Spirochaetota bacterium]
MTGYAIPCYILEENGAILTVKKKGHLPILVVIPHGGCRVPEELSGYEAVTRFDLFIQSDTCANELFSFGERVAGTLDTDISRLFIDLDRPYTALQSGRDGVIKKTTLYGKPLFREELFPDEIAIPNLVKRYWLPFHDAIKNIVTSGSVRLILECHTIMPVGPAVSRDPGKPRPLVMIEHLAPRGKSVSSTCDPSLVRGLVEQLEKSLSGEEETIAEKFVASPDPSGGFILAEYGVGKIPMVRIGVSRALFLNDAHFNFEYLKVDELRIRHLRGLIWSAVEKFYTKYFS